MTDPATDPRHNLTDQPQDPDAPRYPIRLGTFLALLRVLAGRRGHATVTWSGGGFVYRVRVQRMRQDPTPVLDSDPTADDTAGAEIIAALAGDDTPA